MSDETEIGPSSQQHDGSSTASRGPALGDILLSIAQGILAVEFATRSVVALRDMAEVFSRTAQRLQTITERIEHGVRRLAEDPRGWDALVQAFIERSRWP